MERSEYNHYLHLPFIHPLDEHIVTRQNGAAIWTQNKIPLQWIVNSVTWFIRLFYYRYYKNRLVVNTTLHTNIGKLPTSITNSTKAYIFSIRARKFQTALEQCLPLQPMQGVSNISSIPLGRVRFLWHNVYSMLCKTQSV
jgi:hypothetical protein